VFVINRERPVLGRSRSGTHNGAIIRPVCAWDVSIMESEPRMYGVADRHYEGAINGTLLGHLLTPLFPLISPFTRFMRFMHLLQTRVTE
jgi:hypothetical protein